MRFLKAKRIRRPEEVGKVLLVRLSHLGDVIMGTSALEAVREIFPKAEVTLLVKNAYVPLLENNQYIDRIYGFDAPWNTCRRNWFNIHRLLTNFVKLKKDRFDLAINLEDDRKSNILLCLLGIKYRIGFNIEGSGKYLTSSIVSDLKKEHRVKRLSKLMEHTAELTGISLLDHKHSFCHKPQVFINECESDKAEGKLKDIGFEHSRIVAVHAWAGAIYKSAPIDLYNRVIGSLCREIEDLRILLIVGPDDLATGNLCLPDCPHRVMTVKANLKEMAALLSKCDLYIGGDTGVSHLAAALNVPTICLFGASLAHVWKPWGEEVHVIRSDLKCSPCVSPGETFWCSQSEEMKCLSSLDYEEIMTVALEIIERNAKENYEKTKVAKAFS